MARRGAPALYELLKKTPIKGGGGGEVPVRHAPGSPAPAAPGGTAAPAQSGKSLFTAGGTRRQAQSIQVPVGWVVVAGIVALVGVLVAYRLGRGGSGEPQQQQQPQVQPMLAENPPPVQPAPHQPPPAPATRADNQLDPRVKGYRYYVLAHPSTERAPAMVEFCRANGLDAYLVPDDNAMLRKIIVLPGYRDSSERNSPVIRALEADIRRVGEKWKHAARGNKDFSDAYPEIYR